jgi:ABC-type oligopeptide transport system substrate-binding subunit
MKKLLIAVAFAVFAACNSNSDKAKETAVSPVAKDTATLNQAALNDNSEVIEASGIPDTFVTTDGSKFVRVPDEPKGAAAAVAASETNTNKTSTNRTSTNKTTSKATAKRSGKSSAGSKSSSGSNSGAGTSGAGTAGSGGI